MPKARCKKCATVFEFEPAAAIVCPGCKAVFNVKAPEQAPTAAPVNAPVAQPPVAQTDVVPQAPAPSPAAPLKSPGNETRGVKPVLKRQSTRSPQAQAPRNVGPLIGAAAGALMIVVALVLLVMPASAQKTAPESKPPDNAKKVQDQIASLRNDIVAEQKKLGALEKEMASDVAALKELQFREEMLDRRFSATVSGTAGEVKEARVLQDKINETRVKVAEDIKNLKALDPVAVIARCQKCVAIIVTDVGSGSGFILGRHSGLLLTNYHVVEGARSLTVKLQKRDNTETVQLDGATVIAADPDHDLALLRLPAVPENVAVNGMYPAATVRDGAVAAGENVFAIGNPGMGAEVLDFTVSRGIVSNASRDLGGVKMIQTSAPVNPGNSGGPLFDEHGCVIGVVTAKGIEVEAVTFAVPTETIDFFYQRRETDPYCVRSTFAEWEKQNNPIAALGFKEPDLKSPNAIALPAPVSAMKLSADGQRLYVLMGTAGSVVEIKLAQREVGRTYTAGTPVSDFELGGANSDALFLACPLQKKVARVQVRDMSDGGHVVIPEEPESLVYVGGSRESVIVTCGRRSPSGNSYYVERNDFSNRTPRLPNPLSHRFRFVASSANTGSTLVVLSRPVQGTLQTDTFPLSQLQQLFSTWATVAPQQRSALEDRITNLPTTVLLSMDELAAEGSFPRQVVASAADRLILGRRRYRIGAKLVHESTYAASEAAGNPRAKPGERFLLQLFDNIVSASPNGKWAASWMNVYDAGTTKIIRRLPFVAGSSIFSRDGKTLYLASAKHNAVFVFPDWETAFESVEK
jgi:S1-C subfamily serine protease